MENDVVERIGLSGSVMLLNHGPTILLSSRDAGIDNVMPVAWVSPLSLDPPMLTAVVFPKHKTYEIIRNSGHFAVQIPTAEQANMVYTIGHVSLADHPDKLKMCGVDLFRIEGFDLPFVSGCAAWLACRIVRENPVIDTHNLFIAEVAGAWSNIRHFRNRRWQFGPDNPLSSTLHHTGGGNFFRLGDPIKADIEVDRTYL